MLKLNHPIGIFLALTTLTIGLSTLSLSKTARAEDAAEPAVAESTRKINLTSQAPATTQRTFHMHDGFYLRANFGYGSFSGGLNLTDAGGNSGDADLSGSGLGLDLLVGTSPAPGFAIGGALMTNLLFSADYEFDVGKDTSDAQSNLVGVFVDGFPVASGPWHVGGVVGLAQLQLDAPLLIDSSFGVGGAIFGGYDAWVADDVAVGGLLRLTLARTSGSDNDLDMTASAGGFMFMFTALYH